MNIYILHIPVFTIYTRYLANIIVGTLFCYTSTQVTCVFTINNLSIPTMAYLKFS